jgi:uncharacterized protein (TIGR03437 family)
MTCLGLESVRRGSVRQVANGGRLRLVSTAVFSSAPAILSTAGNGLGQGHIYVANTPGSQILADQSAPAKAGDVLVIYCVGLGAVNLL